MSKIDTLKFSIHFICVTICQDNFPAVNEAELKEMDRRIVELQETVKKTSEECHKKETSKCHALISSLYKNT